MHAGAGSSFLGDCYMSCDIHAAKEPTFVKLWKVGGLVLVPRKVLPRCLPSRAVNVLRGGCVVPSLSGALAPQGVLPSH